MSKTAKVYVNPKFVIGDISRRLYSAFLEPIGAMVNGSMYNPGHPTADEQGFRKDWIEGLKSTDLPAVRLPGGNFMSGWDWKDSIGPKEQRKAHLDLAWSQFYDNEVGHDEYLQWAEKVGIEPMYTINLGTGDINDAIYITEYTNFEGGTYWSDLRKKNGHEKPYGVKVWYLGNEMDGPWQIGSWEKDPKGYGVLVNETSKVMKWVDGEIETAVCVSCTPDAFHYPEWDLQVLQECYDTVDYISMHHYQGAETGNYAEFMAASRYFEDYIRTEIGLCDYVQQLKRSPKVMMLSLDEYGVMSRPAKPLNHGREAYLTAGTFYPKNGKKEFVRHDPSNMHFFDFSDGDTDPMLTPLANAAVIMEMLRHADRVKIGCMTGGLGCACAIDAEHTWRNASYYTYADLMKYGKGVSVRTAVECDKYDLPSFALDDTARYHEQDQVDLIDSAAAFNEEDGEFTVFIINRDWEDTADFELKVSDLPEGYKFEGHYEMYTADKSVKDTYENPTALVPKKNETTVCENGSVKCVLQPISWNVFHFVKA